MSFAMNRAACDRATCNFAAECWGVSPSSEKFDFRNQPAEVVLSVNEIEHDRGGSDLLIMSIHGPMMDARCSNMLIVARRRRSCGI